MPRDEKVFKRYKILLGMVLFLTGFSLFLLPSWLGWTNSNPSLAGFVQALGSFASATIAVAFIHGIFVKEYEQTHILESLADIVSESISPIDCRQCIAILSKCQPNTPKCTRVQEVLVLDDIISRGETTSISSYDAFVEHLKQRLFESTESLHTMPLTRESLRNFYDGRTGGRGNRWREAQIKWVKEHGKMGIKRIALINEEDLVDAEFKSSLKELLSLYDTFCDLRICDIKKARGILSDPGFVARDFGVFIKNSNSLCALFTFISVYQGNAFVKSAGNEYFSKSPEVLALLQKYFFSIWDNSDLERESNVLLNTLGVRNGE